jgi:hypothetical protein
MSTAIFRCQTSTRGNQGFGLIDALVALTLLAVTLLGACGSLHFALRATRAAAWQARAVDLVADLDEDLQHLDPALPLATRIASWRARLQRDLPAAEVAALDSRSFVVGERGINWLDLRLNWNGAPGQRRHALSLPLAHGQAP